MKKFVLLSFVLTIILCCSSCGFVKNLADFYIKHGEKQVQNDVEINISDLQESVQENKDANNVTDVPANEADVPVKEAEEAFIIHDFTSYSGDWTGDAFLNVYMPNERIMEIAFTQSNYNASRVSIIEQALPISSFDGNKVTFAFVDSWYNTGNMTIVFKEELIECTISDVEYSQDAMFWVSEGVYPLVRYEEPVYDVSVESDITYEADPDFHEVNPYLFPSDTVYMTEDDVSGLPKEYVALIRNEIYARHGYIFNNKDYADYFSQKSWYEPDPNYNVNMLSVIENHNIEVITDYELKMGWR